MSNRQNPNRINFALTRTSISRGLATALFSLNAPLCCAHESLAINYSVLGGILLFILIQTIIILGLQRSRINNKRARSQLRESQKNLEARIEEHTQNLNKTNQLLIDEVDHHEATGRQLRDTKDYLQSMINSMPSIIIGVSAQGEVTHWNAAAEEAFEIFSQDALGHIISELLPQLPIAPHRITQTIREGSPYQTQYCETLVDDSKRYFDITIYPLIANTQQGTVIRIDDVTLRVTIENMMIQNEKMYSLGEVATGIAHEINNPLSVILQNVQNILRRTQTDFSGNQKVAAAQDLDLRQIEQYLQARNIPALLESIRAAGERAATIVTNMLAFSHGGNKKNNNLAIKPLIEQTLAIFQSFYSQQPVNIKIDIAAPLPCVNGSAPELQQVLLNLLRNARQALCSENVMAIDATIWIKVYQQIDQLVIEIQDNGNGMTENVKNHIFEPFFTTKALGAGTGLGLSVSYFIITEHHQGTIDVKSHPNKGSTFTIKLPLQNKLAIL
jgi:two-component system, NtrC family, sensor kinase